MKKIKVIVSIVIAIPALMLFAGEAPVDLLPVQLLAGGVLAAVLAANGAFRRDYVA